MSYSDQFIAEVQDLDDEHRLFDENMRDDFKIVFTVPTTDVTRCIDASGAGAEERAHLLLWFQNAIGQKYVDGAKNGAGKSSKRVQDELDFYRDWLCAYVRWHLFVLRHQDDLSADTASELLGRQTMGAFSGELQSRRALFLQTLGYSAPKASEPKEDPKKPADPPKPAPSPEQPPAPPSWLNPKPIPAPKGPATPIAQAATSSDFLPWALVLGGAAYAVYAWKKQH